MQIPLLSKFLSRKEPEEETDLPDMSDDPYQTFRNEWSERFADVFSREKAWRRAFFGALLGVVILAWMNVHLSGRAQIVPHIVEVNSETGSVLGSYDPTTFKEIVSENVYRAAIIDWIEALRRVTPDRSLQDKFLSKVKGHISSGDPVVATVNEIYLNDNPYERAKTEIAEAEITEFNKISESSWYVLWTEKSTRRGASTPTYEDYAATITARQGTVHASNRFINPLGIYIVLFNMERKN